ncbi:hypothetical protein [Limnohabitans sp.]|jgi:hypothetical protein
MSDNKLRGKPCSLLQLMDTSPAPLKTLRHVLVNTQLDADATGFEATVSKSSAASSPDKRNTCGLN